MKYDFHCKMENIWLRKTEIFVLNPFAILSQTTDGSLCFPFLSDIP